MAFDDRLFDRLEVDREIEDTARGVILGFKTLYDEQVLCDFIIQTCDGVEFHVHKAYMAAVSDYFRVMLSGTTNMCESRNHNILLQNVNGCTMQLILSCIYGNVLALTMDNVGDVLNAATLLQIERVQWRCMLFLESEIQDNILQILDYCKLYSLGQLRNQVDSYILSHFPHFARNEIFQELADLEYEDLVYYLEHKIVEKVDSFMKYQIIMRWLEVDLCARRVYVAPLMKYVSFVSLTSCQWDEVVKQTDFLLTIPQLKPIIQGCLSYFSQPLHKRVVLKLPQDTTHSPDVVNNNTPCLVSLVTTREKDYWNIQQILYLKFEECNMNAYRSSTWYPLTRTVPDMVKFKIKSDASVVVINNFMIVCCVTAYCEYQCYIFDVVSVKWESIASVPTKHRSGCVLVAHDCNLLALGGSHDVSKYDFMVNAWEDFSTLPYPLHQMAVCNMGDWIYVSGGKRPDGISDGLFRLHPTDRNVDILPRLPHQYHGHYMIAGDGQLFVMTDTQKAYGPDTVVVYDVKQQQWSVPEHQDMLKSRLPAAGEEVVAGIDPEDYTYFVSTVKIPRSGKYKQVRRVKRKEVGQYNTWNTLDKMCSLPSGSKNVASCLLVVPNMDHPIEDELASPQTTYH